MMRRVMFVSCSAVVLVLMWQLPCVAQQAPATPAVQAGGTPAATSTAPAGPVPKIRIDEKTFNFGEIWEGETIEHDFVVANDGEGTLEITSVRASCGCTASQSDKTIAPGKTGNIKVKFNTTGKGTMPKTVVYVNTNDPVNSRIDLHMEGKAKKKIELTPAGSVFFNKMAENKIEPAKVKMLSHIPKPFKPELQPLPSHADVFKVSLAELQPNKEYELTVAPQPPFPEGSTNTMLVVKTGLDEMPTINIPINMHIPPALEVSPNMIVLGAPPARDVNRPINVSLNAPGELKLLNVACTDPKIKTSVVELVPGRRFRVICDIPAGYNLLNDQQVEIKIETDYAAKKKIVIPVTMRTASAARPPMPGAPVAAPAPPDRPSLDMSVMLLEVGNRKPSEETKQDIYFRNGGGKPLEIARVTGTPGVTIEPNYTKTIAPGAAGMITATFLAPKNPGPFTERVTIESNDTSRPSISVALRGTTRAYVEVEPVGGIDFGRRREDHANPRAVKLTYTGPGKIKYLKAESTSPQFIPHLEQDEATGVARVEVEAKPPFAQGVNKATVRVTTDNDTQPMIEVPVALTMPSQVTLEPGQLLFLKGETRLQRKGVKINNYGEKPLHILAIERSNSKLLTQFFPDEDGMSYQLFVSVPAEFQPSPQGEELLLRTDSADFKEMRIPLVFKTVQELVPR